MNITQEQRIREKLESSRFNLLKQCQQEQFVTKDQDCITISTRNLEAGKHHGYNYHIELSRIDTPEKVIEWIRHLCGKVWFSQEHCRQLIQASTDKGASMQSGQHAALHDQITE